jgi:DNA-binding transcriptional LysR family regulator
VLDLRRLRALRAVVETGSVTAAAEQIGYTPSAVSQHVNVLERETGTVLLERSGRGVRPTPAGRLLAEHAGRLLDQAAEAEGALAALRAGEMGMLRLLSFASAGAALVPPALATVRQTMPRLEIEFQVAERDDSIPMVRQGEADLAVVVTPPESNYREDGLLYNELLDDPYRVALPRRHPLARRRQLRLRDLAGEPWVQTVCALGCCQDAEEKAFREAGFVPRRALETDEYWHAQAFVAADLGVALIPTLALGAQHDGVAVRRLHPDDEMVRHVEAVTRPSHTGHPPLQAMLAALTDVAIAHSRSVAATRGSSRFSARPASSGWSGAGLRTA